MVLTDEQAYAVDLFKSSSSLKISAFAGTGKTSTLTAVAGSTRRHGLYLAFNKSIASEAATKFPRSVDCRTTHSIAFRAVPSQYKGNDSKLTQSLYANRVAQLLNLEELVVGNIILKPRNLGYLIAKTVQNFCQSGWDEITPNMVPMYGKLKDLDNTFKWEFSVYLSKMASHLWDIMLDPSSDAPLGHDGYLKLWSLSRPCLNYDYILLDEAQDTNGAVLSVLRDQDAHLTLVGDRHQQIYEWRGAVNAMASMETDAEAALTRSFRFGDAIAEAANSVLMVLGEERHVLGNARRDTKIAGEGQTDAILCRTNAGVVTMVIDALNRHRMPYVVGGVMELIKMLEDVTKLKLGLPAASPDFFGFKDWNDVVEFSTTEEGQSLRSFVKLVQERGEQNLIDKLKLISTEESSADLIISTGHKAKGREWDSVTLHTDFEPRLNKETPPRTVMNGEEARLLYVAITRARQLLVVPPLLAQKWNAPVVATQEVQPPQAHTIHQPVRVAARPDLPAFAKPVREQLR